MASKRRENEGRPSKRARIDHNSEEIEKITNNIFCCYSKSFRKPERLRFLIFTN
jgi:hypothetical protein